MILTTLWVNSADNKLMILFFTLREISKHVFLEKRENYSKMSSAGIITQQVKHWKE